MVTVDLYYPAERGYFKWHPMMRNTGKPFVFNNKSHAHSSVNAVGFTLCAEAKFGHAMRCNTI